MSRLFQFLISMLILVNPVKSLAQEIDRSVLSSGYFSDQNSGSWVLGETIIGEFTSVQTKLTNGFLQGDFFVTAVNDAARPSFKFEIYPNPFVQEINIRHDALYPLHLVVKDITGHLVFFRRNAIMETRIDFKNLPSGTYFLNYLTNRGEQGAFKIIKIR